MAKTKSQSTPMIPTSKGEGPQWFESYDMRWLKGIRDEHPDGHLVEKYEREFGEIL